MPYVKISDPNIIDLSAWHQVINVINQHSDSINALTNNFGIQGTGVPNWNGETNLSHEFAVGPQKILFGKETLDTAQMADKNNEQYFYGDILFEDAVTGTKPFSARPIVTGTIAFGHSSIESLLGKNHNIVLTLFNITPEKFSFRVTRATSSASAPLPLEGKFYLNWTAIGPK